jgi:hypothetical protein
MRISFDIHTSHLFTPESYIGCFKADSIPTTSVPLFFNTSNHFFLTNILSIETDKEGDKYNGEYFVNRSVVYLEDGKNYPPIELYIENHNEKKNTFLFLKGTTNYASTEMLIPVKLVGEIEAEMKSLVIPRTSLDFICVNEKYYQCHRVVYEKLGGVVIHTSNGMGLNSFRASQLLIV